MVSESRCKNLAYAIILPEMASMSHTEIYHVAYTAKIKLRRASSATECDLRFLVGHSNLLKTLTDDFTVAETQLGQTNRMPGVIPRPVFLERSMTASNQSLSVGKATVEAISTSLLASKLPYSEHLLEGNAIEDDADIAFDDENDAEHVLTRVPSRRTS